MKQTKFLICLAALVLIVLLAGCQSPGLQPELIKESVDNVSSRHDKYVEADDTLTPTQKEAFLLESDLLRRAVNEAMSSSTAPE